MQTKIYKKYKIQYEFAEFMLDFYYCFIDILFDTYLGDDVMVETEDIEKHLTYVFRKTEEHFQKQNYNIRISPKLKYWMKQNTYIMFYRVKKTNDLKKEILKSFKIFQYDFDKSKAQLEEYIDLYNEFKLSFTLDQ